MHFLLSHRLFCFAIFFVGSVPMAIYFNDNNDLILYLGLAPDGATHQRSFRSVGHEILNTCSI